MKAASKVTFGKFEKADCRSDDTELDILQGGNAVGWIQRTMVCTYEGVRSSYDKWAVGAYTVVLFDVDGEVEFEVTGAITWRDALKAAKGHARAALSA